METVNNLISQRNAIEAEIASIELGIMDSNTKDLIYEALCFMDKVGDGYISADYYASARYYSRIPGVKNLGINYQEKFIWVKVYSPKGKLLPKNVTLRGIEYAVSVFESSKFKDEIDY